MMNAFARPAEGRIRLFLDSANRADWAEWLSSGLFYGITTNPTILEAAGVACTVDSLNRLIHAALEHTIHEVHVQTWGETADLLFERGAVLAAINNHRVVIRVPITRAGVAAVRRLQAREVKTTFTAVYSVHQALTAAVIGADYVAPCLGRMSNCGRDGVAEVTAMHTLLERLDSPTRLLVESVGTADELARLAQAGLDAYTFGAPVAAELFTNEQKLNSTAASEAAANALELHTAR